VARRAFGRKLALHGHAGGRRGDGHFRGRTTVGDGCAGPGFFMGVQDGG
jgi:hypothetical protein